MNAQIRRLFFLFALMFVALVATSSYWLWRAPALEAKQGNPNLVVRQLTIKRGLLYAADGKTVLAANREKEVQGRTWYLRRYPRGELVAHPVGYSTVERSRTGMERSFNDWLTGSTGNLEALLDRTVGKLRGLEQEGDHVVTTIQLPAQRAAMEGLGGKCGAVVALAPESGAVLAMASRPAYDPNLVESEFDRIVESEGACEPAAPLLNRATAGLFIPGSIFKVVTATAALDTGRFEPSSEFVDQGYCIEYGQKVFNYADQSGPTVYGRVDFATALENSINSVFCEVGKELGPMPVLEYAQRYGFYEDPPVNFPADELRPSGLYDGGKLFVPEDPNAVDPGRLAFGQERLQVTPLQMAMVAAAIANGGVLMEPRLAKHAIGPDGEIVERFEPKQWRRVMKPETAAELTAMMTRVVESGTGTAAQIGGVGVAGKTGTAETGREDRNVAWFISFAPADAPKVAVAVAVPEQDGTGGRVAAPIAKAVMEAVLGRNA